MPRGAKSNGAKGSSYHMQADDSSVYTHVTQISYESSYTAQSRRAIKSMKLSNSAVDIKNKIQSDNKYMDGVLEGISAMTNFLTGHEQKHTSIHDLAESRINLDDCLKLKQEIREKIKASKRERRKDLFTSNATDGHGEFLGDDMSLITDTSSQISYMRNTRSPHRSNRCAELGVNKSLGLFLTDDDRDLTEMSVALPNGGLQKLHHLQQKQLIKQSSTGSIDSTVSRKGRDTQRASALATSGDSLKKRRNPEGRLLAPITAPSGNQMQPLPGSDVTATTALRTPVTAGAAATIVPSSLSIYAKPKSGVSNPLVKRLASPPRGAVLPIVSVTSAGDGGGYNLSGSSVIRPYQSNEWVEKQLEWRMNIETRNRLAKKASELDNMRGMQEAPDIKKAQKSWERLKKTPTVMSHLDDDGSSTKSQIDFDEMSLITIDTQQSLKLQKLNNDIQKLLEAKQKNEEMLGRGLSQKGHKKRTEHVNTTASRCNEQQEQQQTRQARLAVGGTMPDALYLIEDCSYDIHLSESNEPADARSLDPMRVESDRHDKLSVGCVEDVEDSCSGGMRYATSPDVAPSERGEDGDRELKSFDSDDDKSYDSDGSDDNQSSYTADQAVHRDLPELKMRNRREQDDYDEDEDDDDDPLYLPTYASEFGTPRPWSLLPEEEKRKITMRAERRNKGLDLYAVKHSVAHGESGMSSAVNMSSSRSGRGGGIVATNRSDQSDYEEDWNRANERASVLVSISRSQLKGNCTESTSCNDKFDILERGEGHNIDGSEGNSHGVCCDQHTGDFCVS